MFFWEFMDWLDHWLVSFGIRTGQWIQRTTEYAGLFWDKARWFYTTLWGKATDLTSWSTYNWIKAAIALVQKIGEIFEYRYFFVEEVFTDLVTKWRKTFIDWWAKLTLIFDEKWTWVKKWYTDWVVYVTWLFDNYKSRIHYAVVTDWPKLAWLIIDRFEDLHNIIEFHVAGWKVFIEDPAQALWDWVKPRLQELVATFLVELW